MTVTGEENQSEQDEMSDIITSCQNVTEVGPTQVQCDQRCYSIITIRQQNNLLSGVIHMYSV